jgi:hypothetical protein
MGKINAQIAPTITKVALSEQDDAIINQHISKYTTFTIDKRALIDSLYKNGKCQFQINIDKQQNWILDIQFNDMHAPDYKQTYVTDNGEFVFEEPYILNTFKGKTSDNKVVRFTIDENNFWGVILDEKAHYVIRPAKDYTKNNTDESFIV